MPGGGLVQRRPTRRRTELRDPINAKPCAVRRPGRRSSVSPTVTIRCRALRSTDFAANRTGPRFDQVRRAQHKHGMTFDRPRTVKEIAQRSASATTKSTNTPRVAPSQMTCHHARRQRTGVNLEPRSARATMKPVTIVENALCVDVQTVVTSTVVSLRAWAHATHQMLHGNDWGGLPMPCRACRRGRSSTIGTMCTSTSRPSPACSNA